MLNIAFVVGMLVFAISSAYFYILRRGKEGLNSAFLVSFLTLVSYVLMWQGKLTVSTAAGEPIYWSRWLFYGASCTLLMLEISQLKGVRGGKLVQLLYLTVIVMFTGFLAARDVTGVRWAFFVIGALAYLVLIVKLLSVKTYKWVRRYIWFGWTLFPIVFLLGPTGWGWFGAGLTSFLYLLLDLYTKVLFSIKLARGSH